MFNFKTLKLTKRCDSESTNSFVGIRRNENGEVEFRLPHGFDNFPENDFEATKDLFFKMYRTFKKFEFTHRDDKKDILDQRPNGKDQIQKEKDGYRFKNKEDNEVVLYSKIALIENLLDVYRDLALDQIERRIGADEKVDYSKIDRYLDRAIYLPKDVIYIDEMDLPRQTLRYESTTLIDLFCFIVSELQNELAEDIEPRVQELAHRFGEQHLSHEESLFNEETFETTIRTLKGVLDDIDKRTAYKDEDYWRLYDAIETFLYGELDMDNPHEDGTFWGISNFSSVWEDICATCAFANYNDSIIYADTNIIFKGKRAANTKLGGYFPIYIKPKTVELGLNTEISTETDLKSKIALERILSLLDKLLLDDLIKLKECAELEHARKTACFLNPFFIKFRNKKRWLRPDMVIDIKNEGFIVYDWKYVAETCFVSYNKKVEQDITKQLCYEFAVKKSMPDSSIQNQFVIPWFGKHEFMDDKILYHRIQDSGLKVLKLSFPEIQQIYLTHD